MHDVKQVKSPKVSVILTSYNHGKYIAEAIDSVLNQTFADFELIIWDDVSSDNSWEIICSYDDNRIQAYRNDQNMGGGNVNRALGVVCGEYVAIHHSDDIWELDKLKKQVEFLDVHSEFGAIFTWVQLINEHGDKYEGNWFNQENKSQWKWLNELFNEKNTLNHPSILIRRKCYQDVGLYRSYLKQTPDAEMWSRLLIKFPIHIIKEKLTLHRLFSDYSNTSGQRLDVAIRASNEWNVLRKNLLLLTKFEEIVAVFPKLERFRNSAGFDLKFLLAMACLYECEQKSAWQLGLSWLFDLLSDSARAEKIKMLYAFSYIDLIKLTSEFDVYFITGKKIIDEQTKVIDEQTKVIDEIYSSGSWRLTKPLRALNQWIENLK